MSTGFIDASDAPEPEVEDDPSAFTPEPDLAAPDETTVSERPCDDCAEEGTTAELPVHGECLIRRTFGGIATIVTPEDVGTVTDADGAMTIRESAFAVELLIGRTTADDVLRAHIDGGDLENRRDVLAYLRAVVTDDTTELEKRNPKLARELKIRAAVRGVIQAITDMPDGGDAEGDRSDEPGSPQ